MKEEIIKRFQFYATPEDMAYKLVNMTLNPFLNKSVRILEPSAGQGSIIKAIENWHLNEAKHLHIKEVTAVEFMNQNAALLKKEIRKYFFPVEVIESDFLKYDQYINYFDYVIANPPFSKGQDIEHFYKMYEVCKPGGTITSIMSVSWLNNTSKKYKDFREWLGIAKDETWVDKINRKCAGKGLANYSGLRITENGNKEKVIIETYEAGAFDESGTSVITCIIQIKKNDVSW
mgnify:CR=1 FL=1